VLQGVLQGVSQCVLQGVSQCVLQRNRNMRTAVMYVVESKVLLHMCHVTSAMYCNMQALAMYPVQSTAIHLQHTHCNT